MDHSRFDAISKNLQDLINSLVMFLEAKRSWTSPFAPDSSGYFLGHQSNFANVDNMSMYHLLLISLGIKGENSSS